MSNYSIQFNDGMTATEKINEHSYIKEITVELIEGVLLAKRITIDQSLLLYLYDMIINQNCAFVDIIHLYKKKPMEILYSLLLT